MGARHRAVFALILAAGLAVFVAGGASGAAAKSGAGHAAFPPIQANAALHALLPASIQSAGVLQFATNPQSPPYEFYAANNTTLTGAEIDLGNAIAAELGVKANWNPLAFAGIIPAIESGRYDLSMSTMADTPVREQTINFVEESTDGNSIIVPAGDPLKIKTMADLCGHSVGVVTGTIYVGMVEDQNKTCAKSKQISLKTFPDQNSAYLAVRTGRVDANINDASSAAYFIKTQPKYKLQVLTFHLYGEGYNAIGVKKDNPALLLCVQQAVQRLIQQGAYQKIFASWGLKSNEVPYPLVNDGLRFNQPTG